MVTANLRPAEAAGRDFDNTFDGNRRVATDFGAEDYGTDMVIQPDGKIVVVGFTGPTSFAARSPSPAITRTARSSSVQAVT